MKKKIKILIVEDEALTAMVIVNNLRKMGYDVLNPEATGKAAIKKAEEEKPDIIFMDLQLTDDIDGITASKLIQSKYDVPIVLMTGYSIEDFAEEVKNIKIFDILTKPILIEEMEKIIKKLYT